MRCLVTGVAGFIGSSLAEELVAHNHEVIGIDSFTDYYPRIFKEANLKNLKQSTLFHFLDADLSTFDISTILSDREWLFHQAAQPGVRTSWGHSFASYLAYNVTITQRLLEAAINAPVLKRFVFASSSSVYGNMLKLPVTENVPLHPISPYGVTKLASENLCSAYWFSYRVPVVSLRYFTVYGPRQRPDMLIYRLCKALLKDEEIFIYGDGKQGRDFTYIDDIVTANILAASLPDTEGDVFNIASGSRVSVSEVISLLESLVGKKARICLRKKVPGDVHDTYADISHAQQGLGYKPQVSLVDGLDRQLAFLLGEMPRLEHK